MNKKIKLILKLFAIFLVIAGIIIIPKIKGRIDVNNLKDEVKDVIMLIEENKIEDAKRKMDGVKTSSSRKKTEEEIENYLLIVSDIYESVIVDKENTIDAVKKDIRVTESSEFKTSIESSIADISNKKNEFNKLYEDNKDFSFEKEEKMTNLYRELVNDIYTSNILKNIEGILSDTQTLKSILEYLKSDDYEIENNEIVFKTRKAYEEYNALFEKFDYVKVALVKDTTGPLINASNISINKGAKLNLQEKIKCYDEVDSDTECIIDGNVDVNKAGKYNVTITSIDKSGNESKKNITVEVKEVNVVNSVTAERTTTSNPYYIEVIRNQNVTIVYGKDENGEYNKIVRVFTVSTGRNNWTPTGTFKTTKGYDWGLLNGGVYGQYSTRIVGSILFHSVPYYSKDKGNLEWEEYNKLGDFASRGCIRLTVRDVKWIFDNVNNGTTVKIYDGNLPEGVVKPTVPKIDGTSPNKGWDPTDPDPNNPWNK